MRLRVSELLDNLLDRRDGTQHRQLQPIGDVVGGTDHVEEVLTSDHVDGRQQERADDRERDVERYAWPVRPIWQLRTINDRQVVELNARLGIDLVVTSQQRVELLPIGGNFPAKDGELNSPVLFVQRRIGQLLNIRPQRRFLRLGRFILTADCVPDVAGDRRNLTIQFVQPCAELLDGRIILGPGLQFLLILAA